MYKSTFDKVKREAEQLSFFYILLLYLLSSELHLLIRNKIKNTSFLIINLLFVFSFFIYQLFFLFLNVSKFTLIITYSFSN